MIKYFISIACCLPVVLHAQSPHDSTAANWSGALEAYYYFIPNEKTPPTFVAYADHSSLHLETRFNYEDINTFSAFTGKNFEISNPEIDITITPMAGFVLGRTNGFTPALEFNLSYSKINLYSENEYVLDFRGKNDYFFYSWTQLSASILKNIRAGALAQSLRWFKTKFDIQRGVYAEYSTGIFTFDADYFNPFTNYNFFVASVEIDFGN